MGQTTAGFQAELEEVKKKVPVGARYHHYKSPDKTYRIVGHGFIEATGEPAIIYQAEYDNNVWIRPAAVFLESVEWEGATIPRFMRLYDTASRLT